LKWKILKGNPRKDILELLELMGNCENNNIIPYKIEIVEPSVVVEEFIYPYYRIVGSDWTIYLNLLRRIAKIEGNPDEEAIKKLKRYFEFCTKFSVSDGKVLAHLIVNTKLPELIEIAFPLFREREMDDVIVNRGKISLIIEEEINMLFVYKIFLRIRVEDVMIITIEVDKKHVNLHIRGKIQKADKPWGSINYYKEFLKHFKEIKEAIDFAYKKLLEEVVIEI